MPTTFRMRRRPRSTWWHRYCPIPVGKPRMKRPSTCRPSSLTGTRSRSPVLKAMSVSVGSRTRRVMARLWGPLRLVVLTVCLVPYGNDVRALNPDLAGLPFNRKSSFWLCELPASRRKRTLSTNSTSCTPVLKMPFRKMSVLLVCINPGALACRILTCRMWRPRLP